MAGIYIHIPFCRKACHYCDFHFSTQHDTIDQMVEAIDKELVIRKHYLKGEKIETIYFGGGTPSLLSEKQLAAIFETLYHEYDIYLAVEVTLESNPDDITPAFCNMWKKLGINRLSIGIQSFREEDLQWMNRAHTAEQARRCVGYAQEAGFSNITIDLIYGVPGLSNEKWRENIHTAFKLGIDHISCYALTVEAKTALASLIRQRKVEEPDDALASQQFQILMEECQANDFEHYEISNFARNKKYSKHNTSYWKGTKYLGAGPAAHSYDKESRQWNVYNNQGYLRSMRENKVPFEREELTKKDNYNEYILTSLRTMWGINTDVIQERFGEAQAIVLRSKMQEFINAGQISQSDSVFTLTREGKFFADRISAELFL